MAKSAIYVANGASNLVALGGIIPLGSAVHGYGCGIRLNGNSIAIGSGYYECMVSVTESATTAGEVGVQLSQDGVALTGASGSVTSAAEDSVVISFPCLIRVNRCGASLLTLTQTGGSATVTNVAIEVIQK